MQIQIGSGNNIKINNGNVTEISNVVEGALHRYRDQITRVEVHLSDENSNKKTGYDALRCMLEARLEGRQPIAVTHRASTINHAIDGAANKLARLIESTLGRHRDQKRERTDPPVTDQEMPEKS